MIRQFKLVSIALLLISILAQRSNAMDPVLGGVIPVGLQRGVETEVIFGGARFSDAEQLLFYSPGLEVKKLEVVNGLFGVADESRNGRFNLGDRGWKFLNFLDVNARGFVIRH